MTTKTTAWTDEDRHDAKQQRDIDTADAYSGKVAPMKPAPPPSYEPHPLLALALRACDDADACQVLGDAVLESEWDDIRVTSLIASRPVSDWTPANAYPVSRYQPWNGTQPTRTWARAVAAVLLFGEWQTPWSLITAHHVRQSEERWRDVRTVIAAHAAPGRLASREFAEAMRRK